MRSSGGSSAPSKDMQKLMEKPHPDADFYSKLSLIG